MTRLRRPDEVMETLRFAPEDGPFLTAQALNPLLQERALVEDLDGNSA